MAMAFTPSEFQQAKFFVCLSVANKLRLRNPEFESSETLQRWISTANSVLGQALSVYLSAYNRCVNAADIGGKLSAAETAQHVRLVDTRDSARAALLEALKTVDQDIP
jgi:hypothetical protein